MKRSNGVVVVCLQLFVWLSLAVAADEQRPDGIPQDALEINLHPAALSSNETLTAWAHGDQVFVKAQRLEEDGSLHIRRLANVVKSIHEADHPDRIWSLHPEPSYWILKPPAGPDSAAGKQNSGTPANEQPPLLRLNLDEPAAVFTAEHEAVADDSGILLLPARWAVTHGELLRYEPQPHKNTVGYWANERDTAEWFYSLDRAGEYDIDILQGCGRDHGGSRVALITDGGKLEMDVIATGHFQNFIWRTAGTVELPRTDRGMIRLEPLKKAGGAVMDVRAIRLVPRGKTRSFQPELADPDSLPSELLPVQRQ